MKSLVERFDLYRDSYRSGRYDEAPLRLEFLNHFFDPADKARHDKIVLLVERMLELRQSNPRTPQEQEMVKREIQSTDRQIDGLIYELYGLTEDEIKIVEGG